MSKFSGSISVPKQSVPDRQSQKNLDNVFLEISPCQVAKQPQIDKRFMTYWIITLLGLEESRLLCLLPTIISPFLTSSSFPSYNPTMSSATLDSSLGLDNSIGAMLIGVIVSAVLHGICLIQAFIYFTRYKKDSLLLKALVATTVVLDAIHLAFITHTVYHYLISNFHSPDRLEFLTWSVIMEALFTGVNGAIVQTFYTYRVWSLSQKNYYFTAIILILILSTAGSGTAWVILSMQLNTYKRLLRISPLTITINALSTTVDVIIASSLCYLLNKARTGFKRSDTVINKLLVFVVNTGVVTTCCAMAALISLVASPNSLIYAGFYFCLGRLYTNSFIATLNARQSIKDRFDDTTYMMMSLPTAGSGTITNSKQSKGIAIRIDTTTDGVKDEGASEIQNDRDEKKDDVIVV